MKILLFGITNVGKSTLGRLLSQKLNYKFDDLDDEIKREYKNINNFQVKYPNDYDRHRKRGEILSELVDKYEGNVVIAVSPIYYKDFFENLLKNQNILAIELQDKPESILNRLVYLDDDNNILPIEINTVEEREFYINDIEEDIKYYKKEYSIIENKFDIMGETPDNATKRLIRFVQNFNNRK